MSQSLIDAAKAVDIAYGEKNWNAVKASVAPGFVYDELGTQRKIPGVDQFITTLQGWAAAFPDSKATFHNAHVSGNTVILELTWRGTHKGPLQMPGGQISATGKTIEIPACQVIEIADGKAKTIRHYFDMVTMMRQIGVSA
jgi:steroid delta-isomerase-like uncharacterized protein